MQSPKSSPQRGEEVILSEQTRTLGIQVRGEINSHTEEQHLQSAECWLKTQAVCKTFQPNVDTFNANVVIGKQKYPVTNPRELSCNKSNYIEINNLLDCFGSKEPHNDDVNSVILSDSERSHKRADFINSAILRGLNDCSPQKDETKHVIVSDSETIQSIVNQKPLQKSKYAPSSKSKISVLPQGVDMRSSFLAPCGRADLRTDGEKRVRIASRLSTLLRSNMYETLRAWSKFKTGQGEGLKVAFTEPSRGMSGAKVEQTSAETLSFRCVCERCRLMRGDVRKTTRKVAFTLAEVLITLGIIGVIATLTIPTVINKIKHKELEASFKSAYSTFSQGFINMRNEDGEGLSKNYTYYDREKLTYPYKNEFENKFYKYSKLKSIGVCDYGGKKIRNYNGTKEADAYSPSINWYTKHLLSNGMCFYSTINASTIMLFVDTNGIKGPNKLGHDCFYFYIDKNDKLVPFKMTKLLTDEEVENATYPTIEGHPCSIKSKQTGNGIGCAYYAFIDQNPDNPRKGYWESLP